MAVDLQHWIRGIHSSSSSLSSRTPTPSVQSVPSTPSTPSIQSAADDVNDCSRVHQSLDTRSHSQLGYFPAYSGHDHHHNNHSYQNNVMQGNSAPKLRRPNAARLSSLLTSRRSGDGLKSALTSPKTTTTTASGERELAFRLRDSVYNPDPNQMVNTLLTAVMQRMGKPLPPEYSSMLLHVLEAYRGMAAEILRLDSALGQEKVQREIDSADFERTARLWAIEKQDLKQELEQLRELESKIKGESLSQHQSGKPRTKTQRKSSKPSPSHMNNPPTAGSTGKVLRANTARIRPESPTALDVETSKRLVASRAGGGLPYGTLPRETTVAEVANTPISLLVLPADSHRETRNDAEAIIEPSSQETYTSSDDQRLINELMAPQNASIGQQENPSQTNSMSYGQASHTTQQPGTVSTGKTAETSMTSGAWSTVSGNASISTQTSPETATEGCRPVPGSVLGSSRAGNNSENRKAKVWSIVKSLDENACPDQKSQGQSSRPATPATSHHRSFSFKNGDDSDNRDLVASVGSSAAAVGEKAMRATTEKPHVEEPQTGIEMTSSGSLFPSASTDGNAGAPHWRKASPAPARSPLRPLGSHAITTDQLQRDDSSSSVLTMKRLSAASSGTGGGSARQDRVRPEASVVAAARAMADASSSSPPMGNPNSRQSSREDQRGVKSGRTQGAKAGEDGAAEGKPERK